MIDDLMFPEEYEQEVKPLDSGDEPAVEFLGKTFWIRALAYVIDTTVIFLVNLGINFALGIGIGIIGLVIGREPVFHTMSDSTSCLIMLLPLLTLLVYCVIFESLYGASPGKLILGMRVVKEDGSPCSLGAAIKRGLWRYIDALVFGMIAYTNMEKPLQQRLGDKKAHTLVVSNKEPGLSGSRDWPWFIVAVALVVAFQTVVILIQLSGQLTFVESLGSVQGI